MWDGFDKRKFPRVNLQCEVVVHPDSEPKPVAAVTENIGAGGVCVILRQKLERFSKCKIRLDLGAKQPPVECEGKIVWVVPTGETKQPRNRYDTGIEFVGAEPEAREQIRKFIREHEPEAGTRDARA